MAFGGHPSDRTLWRFVDHELSPASVARIAEHMRSCGTCRTNVADFQELKARSRAINAPVPEGLADEVIRRRLEGERVILPFSAVASKSSAARRRLATIAAVGLIGIAVSYALLVRPAGASRGELAISPPLPDPGATIRFVYRPAFFLADQDSLRLRSRTVRADDPPPRDGPAGRLIVAPLTRHADGTFRGQLDLDDHDVFMSAAVEDYSGELVDTNSGKLWDLLIAGEDGLPTSAALEAKYRTLEPRSFVLATGWANELTTTVPREPIGWAMLLTHERIVAGGEIPTHRQVLHRTMVDTVIANLDGEQPGPLAWAAIYARLNGLEALSKRLLDQLEKLDPRHPQVLNHHVAQFWSGEPDESARLRHLDSLLAVHDFATEFMVLAALGTAIRAGDLESVRNWLSANDELDMVPARQLLSRIESQEELHPERVALTERSLGLVQRTGETGRPLRQRRSEYSAWKEAQIVDLQTDLAALHLASGDTASAKHLYSLILDSRPPVEDLITLARILRQQGDSLVVEVAAAVLVDPLLGDDVRDEFLALMPTDSLERAQVLQEAWDEHREGLLQSLPATEAIYGDPLLKSSATADRVKLSSVLEGGPTVLVIWNPSWSSSPDLVKDVEQLARKLNVHTVMVATAFGTPMFARAVATPAVGGVTVLQEASREVADAVGQFALSGLVVVDAEQRIIARPQSLEEAYRIAVAAR